MKGINTAEQYAEARMRPATLEAINIEKREYAFKEKAGKVAGDVAGYIGKKITSKASKPKKIFAKSRQVTVNLGQPVYTEDKSRFFTHAISEERRQLFFK